MSEFVYNFVHNLTIREKAYFKRFSQLYNGNKSKNYLLLYHALEDMPHYDGDILKDKFKDKDFCKYLNSELNYLLGQLLKSLVNFHFSNSPERNVSKAILFIDILMSKGYRKKALKSIATAKKMATKHEFFNDKLKLIQLEIDVLFTQGILGFTKKLKILEAERDKVINQIRNLNSLRLLREQVREHWFTYGYLTDTESSPPFFKNPLLADEAPVLSFRAKEHWLYIRAMQLYLKENHSAAMVAFGVSILFIEKHSKLFKISDNLVIISNYLYNAALARDTIHFDKMVYKLEKIKDQKNSNLDYIDFIRYSRTLELYYQSKDYVQSKLLCMNQVHSYIKRAVNNLGITQYNYIYFLLVRSSILNRDFEISQTLMNEWQNLKTIEYYRLYKKLFSLIIHLELGYIQLIDSELASAIKSLKRHGQYNRQAKAFMQFFKKILANKNSKTDLLIDLKSKLLSINQNAEDKQEKDIKYFDFLIWVDQSIEQELDSQQFEFIS